MIRRPSTRRTAATLLEVLIGFGILGVAAISIMTLFPFAALTMSTATKDDRTTTAAIAGDALVRDWHRRNVVEPTDSKSVEPYHRLMDDPTGKSLATQPPVPSYAASFGTGVARTPLPANSTESSYPVYLDPMGVVAGRGDVGGAGLIPRTNAQAILEQGGNQLLALRYCSLMDGLKFDEGGGVPGGFDMRELRYNFAWVLQRPSNRDRYTVRTQVVVYDRRAHLYNPPGSETAIGATPGTQVTFYPGATQIDIIGGNTVVEIRKGTWVLDAGHRLKSPVRTRPSTAARTIDD
jgi:hypothetical protein